MCKFTVGKVSSIWNMIASRSITADTAMCDAFNYTVYQFLRKREKLLLQSKCKRDKGLGGRLKATGRLPKASQTFSIRFKSADRVGHSMRIIQSC